MLYRGIDRPQLDAAYNNSAAVLERDAMASSRNERNAFIATVETYRTEKSHLTEEDARRAVAQIISHKP